MRIVILAHEKFPERAKTATGVLRYGDYDVAAVLDRDNAGRRVSDLLSGVQDAPIVEGMDAVDEPVDALFVGISPIGGAFDETWRPDVRAALERGCDVVSGLHYFLSEDDEFASLAAEHGCDLRDVRDPPPDLSVSEGVADRVDAEVVLTVGTDCSSGKMTTTLELLRAARERGHDAAFVPTGQTGIMIENWGNPVDRVVSDFAAGAVEEMILERGDRDYLFVEGQGSLAHPAYSGVTASILHGSMADRLVFCHKHGKETVHRYDTPLPPLDEYAGLYETFAAPVHGAEVVAGSLHTGAVESDAAAREAVESFEETVGVPATDPIRFDAEEVLDAVL